MSLSELIMTRVSHDLAGISGALFNTAELLELDPSFGNEAGGLLKETTGNLLARLRLFRALFGVESKEITTALAVDYFKTMSALIKIEGKIETRLQLGMVIVAAEGLIRGGTIRVLGSEVIAEGQVHLDDMSRSVMEDKEVEAGPRQAILLWLKEYARQKKSSLFFESTENKIQIRY